MAARFCVVMKIEWDNSSDRAYPPIRLTDLERNGACQWNRTSLFTTHWTGPFKGHHPRRRLLTINGDFVPHFYIVIQKKRCMGTGVWTWREKIELRIPTRCKLCNLHAQRLKKPIVKRKTLSRRSVVVRNLDFTGREYPSVSSTTIQNCYQ
jgi:hypothetical protein